MTNINKKITIIINNKITTCKENGKLITNLITIT